RDGDLVIVAIPRQPDASKLVTTWARGE
ncbi:cell volume regulation protein A, partial [Amycolatopsis marina]